MMSNIFLEDNSAIFLYLTTSIDHNKEPARNKLVSWFSNFVSWQGATNAHSLSSVIEERRRQGAKGQTKWVSYFLPAPNCKWSSKFFMSELYSYRNSLKRLLTMPAPVAIRKIAIFINAILTRHIDRIIVLILGGEISRLRFARSFKTDIASALADFRNDRKPRFLVGVEANLAQLSDHEATRQIIIAQAEEICRHRILIFGQKIFLGEQIDWHQDLITGYRWPKQSYYQDITIPYHQGDIKFPRELSRFQHLVALGLAYKLTNTNKYASEFKSQILDWIADNPFKRGVNWQCTMDVAIRSANWLVGWELFRGAIQLDDEFVFCFVKSLLEHGLFIRSNLEYYQGMTANHYLADLAGLYAIATMVPQFKRSPGWLSFCRRELETEISKQVYADGTVFEASTCYHRLSLELFFYPALLARQSGDCFSDSYLRILYKLFDACSYLIKPNGHIPQIGDNDSGQFVKLYHRPATDIRYLLHLGSVFFAEPRWKITEFAACPEDIVEIILIYGPSALEAWKASSWRSLKQTNCKRFGDSGWYVMRNRDNYCLCCCGPNGQRGRGGHAHNDKLSLVVSIAGQDVVVDPGTFVYTSRPDIRNQFRSTRYHNTISIANQEQNRFYTNLVFPLYDDAAVREILWESTPHKDLFVGEHYGYSNCHPSVVHRRRLLFDKDHDCWHCQDQLTGEGKIVIELGLHLAPQLQPRLCQNTVVIPLCGGQTISVQFPSPARIYCESYCYSSEYGVKQPAQAVFLQQPVTLPYLLEWKIIALR